MRILDPRSERRRLSAAAFVTVASFASFAAVVAAVELDAPIVAFVQLHRIRRLFNALERKRTMLEVLRETGDAEGVRIFIGAENELFNHAGCSLIIAPFRNGRAEVLGAIGVIGPTRLNYARIIPVLDYTAQVIGRLMPGTSLEVDR